VRSFKFSKQLGQRRLLGLAVLKLETRNLKLVPNPFNCKNYVDNAINTPQYLELVILLAQNVGSDL